MKEPSPRIVEIIATMKGMTFTAAEVELMLNFMYCRYDQKERLDIEIHHDAMKKSNG